jgi:hypothetical protein
MNRSLPIAVALFALLALPFSAHAAIPPPPGNSAGDQYAETYPAAGGDQTTTTPTVSGPTKAVAPETTKEFEQAGPVGAAAAAAAEATAPPRRQGAGGAPSADASGGSGPLDVVKHGLGTSGSDGIGFLLPLLLVVGLTAAATYVYLRRRHTTAE